MRQYIGARYVAKIYENSQNPDSAEWESNVNYEPLTIVTYNNGSYMSKKQVPATVGNPPSNTQYWTQTGFYNGQIAQLQQDIIDINNTLAHIDDEIYLVIGDSWSNFYIGNDHIIDIIAEGISQGKDYYADARGGAGFIGNYGGYTYNDILTNLDGNLTAAQRLIVSNVVVVGGENDGTPTAVELQTAVRSFIDRCAGLYPNAEVTYIHATGAWTKNFNENHRLLTEITNKNFKFLAGFPNVVTTANLYQSDGHLKSEYRNEWTQWVIGFFKSGRYQFYKNSNVTASLYTGEMTVAGGTVNVEARDEMYRIYSNYITLTVTDGLRSWQGNPLLMEFEADADHGAPVIETRGWARLMFSDDSYEIVPIWGTYMSDTGRYGLVITQKSFTNSNIGSLRVRLDLVGHKFE